MPAKNTCVSSGNYAAEGPPGRVYGRKKLPYHLHSLAGARGMFVVHTTRIPPWMMKHAAKK
jgi:hypothetical protein